MVEFVTVVYVVVGLALLSAILLPRLFETQPVSMPIIYVATGLLLFSIPPADMFPSPHEHSLVTEHLAEVVVIVSLMGAGLKLDRPFSLRGWATTWRLLGITMPLTVILTALLGWYVLEMHPAVAILLGAVIAPTDPVLASDVQATEPLEGIEEDTDPQHQSGKVRFALTSEAGLNDGLAFPVTNLAIAAAAAGTASTGWIGEWLLVDVVYRIAVGVAVGYVVGQVLARVVFWTLPESRLERVITGAEALAATFIAYGVTELVGGYGFIAVFVAALVMRHFEWEHEYYRTLDDFAGVVEHLLMGAVLILFGGAIAGGLLAPLGLLEIALGLVLIFLVRPIAGLVGLLGHPSTWIERNIIAGFGIRGIGSFYYLAHGLNEASFQEMELIFAREELWAIVGFFVLVSIVFHGIVVSPIMRTLDRLREERGIEDVEETIKEDVVDPEESLTEDVVEREGSIRESIVSDDESDTEDTTGADESE